MDAPLFVVDAFTDVPFAGNPAAVVLLDAPASETWMQQVAREMRHSETAFLVPEAGGFGLRWFTPAVEVNLCGHATLASSQVLFATGRAKGQVRFFTRSGELGAREVDGGLALDFPGEPVAAAEAPAGMLEALGVEALGVYKNRLDYLVEVPDAAAVRQATPDLAALQSLAARGVMITAPAGEGDAGVDFVSRYFAPGAGVDEDPVTGSAHCALGPFWGARLGKDAVTGLQASARGGRVHVVLRGERVDLVGQAVIVVEGRLTA